MSSGQGPEARERDGWPPRPLSLSISARRRVAAALAILALGLGAGALLLLIPNSALRSSAPLGFNGVGGFVFGAAYPVVGWLIVSRNREPLIGWTFLFAGLFQAVESFSEQYATYGLIGRPGALLAPDVASWVGTWVWMPGLLLLVPMILLFPDGRLPGRRWRPVLWATAVALVLMLPPVFIGLWPYRGPDLLADTLPASITAAIRLSTTIESIGLLLLIPIALATITGIIVRFRRSTGIERQQLKWFASAAVVVVVSIVVFSGGSIPPPLAAIAALVICPLLPAAIGIAVLRYRLYDIDVVIRRTLVYVPLTALLAGTYAASIGISQRLFVAVTGNTSDGAIILSTLILATMFTPIKNALQGRVDRGFRDAQDAERRLQTFTTAIAEDWATPDPARTLRAFLACAVTAVHAAGGAAYLDTGGGEQLVGESPSRSVRPIVQIIVESAGHRYGRIELDARLRGGSFSDRDLTALRTAGERLANTLRGVATLPNVAAHDQSIPRSSGTETGAVD